jgi:hypothetical protein
MSVNIRTGINQHTGKLIAKISSVMRPNEYDYIIVLDDLGYYEAIDGKDGDLEFGGKYHRNLVSGRSQDAVTQAAIDALTADGGGFIELRGLQLGNVTYGSTILICANYKGTRKFYRNNHLLSEVGDLTNLPVMPSFYDYRIEKYDSLVEAINGKTGVIEYSNTDATDVFAFIPTGSVVSIGEGTFSTQIEYTSGSMYFGSGVFKTIIQQVVDGEYVFTPQLTTAKTRLYISDLTIDLVDDSVGSGCLNLDGTCYATLDRVILSNHSGTKVNCIGVYLADTYQVGAYFNAFRDVDVANFNIGYNFDVTGTWTPNSNQLYSGRVLVCNTGVKFAAETTGDHPNGNCIFGTDIEGCDIGIDSLCSDNTMIGGNIEASTSYRIKVAAGKTFCALGIKIYEFEDFGAGTVIGYPVNPIGTKEMVVDQIGWVESSATGSADTDAFNGNALQVSTGVTPSSKGELTKLVRGLSTSGFSTLVDWTKQFKIEFDIEYINFDAELVAWFTLGANTDGILSGSGLGVVISADSLYGQSYGASDQAMNLETELLDQKMVSVKIAFYPESNVSFFVNGIRKYYLTTAGKLPVDTGSATLYFGAKNGATGGVLDYVHITNIKITQQV